MWQVARVRASHFLDHTRSEWSCRDWAPGPGFATTLVSFLWASSYLKKCPARGLREVGHSYRAIFLRPPRETHAFLWREKSERNIRVYATSRGLAASLLRSSNPVRDPGALLLSPGSQHLFHRDSSLYLLLNPQDKLLEKVFNQLCFCGAQSTWSSLEWATAKQIAPCEGLKASWNLANIIPAAKGWLPAAAWLKFKDQGDDTCRTREEVRKVNLGKRTL